MGNMRCQWTDSTNELKVCILNALNANYVSWSPEEATRVAMG
jgi:hypothetical protein